MKLAPEPVAGVPPVAVQANVYGVVPPVPVAVKVTVVPTVPVVGPAMETDKAPGVIDMLADPVAVFALASVIATETVNVPGELKVVVKLELVPVTGLPPVAVQENV